MKRCACGYTAAREEDLDSHIMHMVYVVDESAVEHHCGRWCVVNVAQRLEYLRQQIRAECIAWGEIAELQSLAAHIDAGDTELLEWAGVAE